MVMNSRFKKKITRLVYEMICFLESRLPRKLRRNRSRFEKHAYYQTGVAEEKKKENKEL